MLWLKLLIVVSTLLLSCSADFPHTADITAFPNNQVGLLRWKKNPNGDGKKGTGTVFKVKDYEDSKGNKYKKIYVISCGHNVRDGKTTDKAIKIKMQSMKFYQGVNTDTEDVKYINSVKPLFPAGSAKKIVSGVWYGDIGRGLDWAVIEFLIPISTAIPNFRNIEIEAAQEFDVLFSSKTMVEYKDVGYQYVYTKVPNKKRPAKTILWTSPENTQNAKWLIISYPCKTTMPYIQITSDLQVQIKGPPAKTQEKDKPSMKNTVKEIYSGDLKTESGMSGSPIFQKKSANELVIRAIHVETNKAAFITQDIRDRIRDFIISGQKPVPYIQITSDLQIQIKGPPVKTQEKDKPSMKNTVKEIYSGDLKTESGMSGSPIFQKKSANEFVIRAIHVETNKAAFITQDIRDRIRDFIKSGQKPVPPTILVKQYVHTDFKHTLVELKGNKAVDVAYGQSISVESDDCM